MDAEFVDFLDKKFQRVEDKIEGTRLDLEGKIEGVRLDLKEDIRALGGRISRLEDTVERLATSIDRMIKMYEDLRTEYHAITAQLDRIKAVLKEKLGVEI